MNNKETLDKIASFIHKHKMPVDQILFMTEDEAIEKFAFLKTSLDATAIIPIPVADKFSPVLLRLTYAGINFHIIDINKI